MFTAEKKLCILHGHVFVIPIILDKKVTASSQICHCSSFFYWRGEKTILDLIASFTGLPILTTLFVILKFDHHILFRTFHQILSLLSDIIRIRNQHFSDGQQNTESSFCGCVQCMSQGNRSRHSSGHYMGGSASRDDSDQTLCPTNNSRNTRSVQTSMFEDRQPSAHYPQNQPSMRQISGVYPPGRHAAFQSNVPVQNADTYPNSVNQPNSSNSPSRHSTMRTQYPGSVRPEYQRFASIQENPLSWIPPGISQPLGSSLYREHQGPFSQRSGQPTFYRSISEPPYPSRCLDMSASRRRNMSGHESGRYDSENKRNYNGRRRNNRESMKNDSKSRINDSESTRNDNMRNDHFSRTNDSEFESSRINRGDDSYTNRNERLRDFQNDCQKCRLASGNEQTRVLTTYSQHNSSCAFHSHRRCGDGMPHSGTYPQLVTQNLPRTSTIPENLNSHQNLTETNPAFRSDTGANLNDNEQTSRKGAYSEDNDELEQNLYSMNESNSNLDDDIEETARKTVSVSNGREVESAEIGDDAKKNTPYFDLSDDNDQTARKLSYLDDVYDNNKETDRKKSYEDDLDAENEQTARKHSFFDEHSVTNTNETAKKISDFEETYERSNKENENDKFERLSSNCEMCEDELRMRELKVHTFQSCQAQNVPSACTCQSNESIRYSTGDRRVILESEQSQFEAQRHVTGQSIQSHVSGQSNQSHVTGHSIQSHVTCQSIQSHEPGQSVQSHVPGQSIQSNVTGQSIQSNVTGQSNTDSEVPETIYNRKDGRHSWHEGEQNESRESLDSSGLSSSDPLVYSSTSSLGSSGSSRSSDTHGQPVVLVTFSVPQCDPRRAEAHLREVYRMIEMLKDAGIRVRVDMDRDAFRRKKWNRLDWLDKNLCKVRSSLFFRVVGFELKK